MARTSKRGLEYFPMDIDIFSDLKIRKLIKYQGGKAITIYALLLCNIYKQGYYMEWDKELPFICSELTGFDEAYISEVIKTCLTLGLFSSELYETRGVLTSRGIQERYERICTQCRRACRIVEYNLLLPDEDQQSHIDRQPPVVAEPQQTQQSLGTLDKEIEMLKNETVWLDQLQVLHGMNVDTLRGMLDEFKVQCTADGKERHNSLQDAKQHFNSWLRIVRTKKSKKDDTTQRNGRDKCRAAFLAPDEKKDYGGTF